MTSLQKISLSNSIRDVLEEHEQNGVRAQSFVMRAVSSIPDGPDFLSRQGGGPIRYPFILSEAHFLEKHKPSKL